MSLPLVIKIRVCVSPPSPHDLCMHPAAKKKKKQFVSSSYFIKKNSVANVHSMPSMSLNTQFVLHASFAICHLTLTASPGKEPETKI